MDKDLCYTSAIALAAAIRAKQLSPVELVRAIYARLHEINGRINAFCTLTEEEATKAAKEAETTVMRGGRLGLLLGLPISIKDLLFTSGIRTMSGSRTRENYVPTEDAPAVARVIASGAILIGKTTTPEFGFKAVTDSPVTGITRNPWDTSKTAGGSSGGAGASVASGLGPLALGTDGAGSIRIPASFNGIFGLKPSYGRVAVYPPNPVPFLSHVGPMTRTVRDAALLLSVIAGSDERDLLSLPADSTDYLAACEGGIRGFRVAWSPTLGYAKVQSEVASITNAAARSFEKTLGCYVEMADPGFESPHRQFAILWTMSYALRFRALLEEWGSQMDPGLVSLIQGASRFGPNDFGEALATRSALWHKTREFFERFELLLLPSLPVPAFAASSSVPEGLTGTSGPIPPFPDWIPFTYPWNLTGQPAATVPCGFTRNGLPVGLQIVGRRFADATVLRAAAAFEDAYPWAHQRPIL
jgi:aspartyl-tRNA(Asn)/glutamyl-tRNA(Gln) amidotransferase subunit A